MDGPVVNVWCDMGDPEIGAIYIGRFQPPLEVLTSEKNDGSIEYFQQVLSEMYHSFSASESESDDEFADYLINEGWKFLGNNEELHVTVS